MEDLESTLRIKVDRSDIKSALHEAEREYERSVTALFAKFAGLPGGTVPGGAVSTAATPAPTPVATTASSTFSQAMDRAPRARSSGDIGDGDEGGESVRRRARKKSRSDYFADTGPVEALVSSTSALGSLGGGISASSRFAAAAIKSAALQRAEDIESGAVPGGAAAMGALRYGGLMAAGVTAVGALGVEAVNKSQSVQERYADMSRTLAYGAMAGAFTPFMQGNRLDTNTLFARGANHGMSPEETAAYGASYAQGVGYSRNAMGRGYTWDELWKLRTSGVSDQAIFSIMANARLGAKGSDPTAFVGLAQSQGLAGGGIDRYLHLIAEHTQRLAMKGIKLDMREQSALLTAMRLTPGMENVGERGVAAMTSLGDMAAGIGDELMAPHKAHARMLMMQEVLRGGGSYEDVVRRWEEFSASPSAQYAAVRRGGRLAMKGAMPQLSTEEIGAGVRIDDERMYQARQALGAGAFEPRTAMKIEDERARSIWEWSQTKADEEALELLNRGSISGYRSATRVGGGLSRTVQDIGTGLSSEMDLERQLGALNESIKETLSHHRSANQQMQDALRDIEGAVKRLRDN